MKYVVPEVSSCVRNLHFKNSVIYVREFFYKVFPKCFYGFCSVRGRRLVYIYIYAIYWSLICTCIFVHSVLNQKAEKYSYTVSDGSLP